MKKSIQFLFGIFLFFVSILNIQAEEFNITSEHVILYNMNEEKVLYELASEEQTQIASLTKIMTTIVAIENSNNLEEEVTIPKEAFKGISEYTQVGFKTGDTTTIRDLLYGVMLPSGADAANALAIHISGSISNFVDLMNQKCEELKLKNTHFDNPIGMDSAENYSTASDMAKLLIYSLKNDTFKEIFQAREYTIASLNKTLTTTLIGYSKSYGLDITDITGAKSGFTDGAGLCLASTSTMDDVNYLLITLGASTQNRSNAVRDTLEIYHYYNSTYSYQTVVKKDQKFKTIPIKWGKKESYDILAEEEVSIYLANDIIKNRIKYTYEGIEELNYQMKKGTKLGVVNVTYEGELLTTYDVYLNETLEYYHPVLYAIIIISFLVMITSLKAIFTKKKKKKKTSKQK